MKSVKFLVAGLILCFSFGAHQVAYADPYPIGNPFYNFSSKTCMPAPDLVITVTERNPMGGEPITRQVRVKRDLCEYYDADGKLLGWAYEITGGNWY